MKRLSEEWKKSGEDAASSGSIHHGVLCRSHLYLLFSIICFPRAGNGRGMGVRPSGHLFFALITKVRQRN